MMRTHLHTMSRAGFDVAAQAHEDAALAAHLDDEGPAHDPAPQRPNIAPSPKWVGIGFDAVALLLEVRDGSYAVSSEGHQAWLGRVEKLLDRAGVRHG